MSFPIPRNRYWTVTRKKGMKGGIRCPIKCKTGYRLKNKSQDEFVCGGDTQTIKKDTTKGIMKDEYHNSFGHVLCEKVTCFLGPQYEPAAANGCTIDAGRVSPTTDACNVKCKSGYRLADRRDTAAVRCGNKDWEEKPMACVALTQAEEDQAKLVHQKGKFTFTNPPVTGDKLVSILKNALVSESKSNVNVGFTSKSNGTTIVLYYEYYEPKSRRQLQSIKDIFQKAADDAKVTIQIPTATSAEVSSCDDSFNIKLSTKNFELVNDNNEICSAFDTTNCRIGRCKKGYRFSGNKSTYSEEKVTIKCVGNEVGVPEEFFCEEDTCSIYNADETHNYDISTFTDDCNFKSTNNNNTIRVSGGSCDVNCKTGYIKTNPSMDCTKGVITKAPTCEKVAKCYMPKEAKFITNDTSSSCNIFEGIGEGASCKVKCVDGYKLADSAVDSYTCTNGKLATKPTCELVEKTPEVSSSVASRGISVSLFLLLISYNVKMSTL